MKKVLFYIIFIVSLSISGFAQEKSSHKEITIEEKLDKYKDTFQIQVKDIRMKPSIPYNIDELIESNRAENKVTYVQLGTQVRLMILPKSEILKKKKIEMISTF